MTSCHDYVVTYVCYVTLCFKSVRCIRAHIMMTEYINYIYRTSIIYANIKYLFSSCHHVVGAYLHSRML